MLWKLTAVLAFSLAWLSAPTAWAGSGDETPECCNYNGFYAGIGGGYSWERFPNGDAGNGTQINARVGYRFLDFLALEGLGEYAPEYSGHSGNFQGMSVKMWSGWFNAKVYPLARWTGFIQPYALAGVGYQWADVHSNPPNDLHANVIAGRFGGGIDWFLTEHLFVTTDAAYILPGGDEKSLEHINLGGAVGYRF